MASCCGLNLAIASPMNEEFMNEKRASDVLVARDPEARIYIGHVSAAGEEERPGRKDAEITGTGQTVIERVYGAVLGGSRGEIPELIDRALSEGLPPERIIDEGMITAIKELGSGMKKGVLPPPAHCQRRGHEDGI
jgi:5-methyltetrahydrofolate--homocysteine methyltransferase